ncbi:tetratricopeptide repeat protein [Vulcaniibacterium gelatinicum]|uniref:tetratricopeptide repeat protein n=1 Tax=Vulcaniibacterium gelatinicum TaxID=2598725 RepID=UPI0011C825CF|nr:tetratricopeptide repeat protein [Vulcaniibacterium gelatinicum]
MSIGVLLPQFLRPHWLWALAALPLLALWWRARRRRGSVWRGVVDPHLLPHLLDAGEARRAWLAPATLLLGAALAVLALAGPSWRQVEQPLWQSRTPLVIALDLSSATLAGDLPPSRLLQARAKLARLLQTRRDGEVALVAFADDAFTVAPLTEDVRNVALFLDALAPDVMPVDGRRVDRAIAWSARLLAQGGHMRGDILVLTDAADARAHAAAAEAARAGYRVHALGLGTAAGSLYRDRDGAVRRAALDDASLRALAAAGGGRHAVLRADDGDLRALGVLAPRAGETAAGDRGARAWQDQGYWLLPPLMLLALFAFRRGAAPVLLLACLLWPAGVLQAAEGTLWRRADQVAHARLREGIAAYRAGDYARAAELWRGLETADAHYNRGNALARQGRYEDAIAAYDAALRRAPGMADALANKRALEAALRRRAAAAQDQAQRDGRQQQRQQAKQGEQGEQGKDGASGQPRAGRDADAQAGAQPHQPAPREAGAPRRADTAPTPPPQPADTQAQRAADAAQRARMQRALQAGAKPLPRAGAAPGRAETPAERERRLANEAWLRRIPEDPGALLRARFRLEYERRRLEGE